MHSGQLDRKLCQRHRVFAIGDGLTGNREKDHIRIQGIQVGNQWMTELGPYTFFKDRTIGKTTEWSPSELMIRA